MILSIDVGKHNLSYCILDNQKNIIDWKLIDILDNLYCCKCNKKAIYCIVNCDDILFFCNEHKSQNSSKKFNDFNVITRLLINNLNKIDLTYITKVLVENQPIYNFTMKSISVIIYTYFTMKNILTSFCNASKKIYGKTYKIRKQNSIIKTKELIKNSPYEQFFESNLKKDDLADCYLQAVNSLKFV